MRKKSNVIEINHGIGPTGHLPSTEKNNMLYLINKIVATYYNQYY